MSENFKSVKTSATAKDVAVNIVSQLGQLTLKMLGVKNMTYGTDDKGRDYVTLQIRGSKNTRAIIIALNAMDTYDVQFAYWRGESEIKRRWVNDVYVEELHSVIERETGLCTRLL